jgi:hypothetical protein
VVEVAKILGLVAIIAVLGWDIHRRVRMLPVRAWLIGIVREAIQAETRQLVGPVPTSTLEKMPRIRAGIASTSIPASEPSFEQMQAAAIEEQEKHYAISD